MLARIRGPAGKLWLPSRISPDFWRPSYSGLPWCCRQPSRSGPVGSAIGHEAPEHLGFGRLIRNKSFKYLAKQPEKCNPLNIAFLIDEKQLSLVTLTKLAKYRIIKGVYILIQKTIAICKRCYYPI